MLRQPALEATNMSAYSTSKCNFFWTVFNLKFRIFFFASFCFRCPYSANGVKGNIWISLCQSSTEMAPLCSRPGGCGWTPGSAGVNSIKLNKQRMKFNWMNLMSLSLAKQQDFSHAMCHQYHTLQLYWAEINGCNTQSGEMGHWSTVTVVPLG